jgi:nicotinamide mononucleotide adenylyltransferase
MEMLHCCKLRNPETAKRRIVMMQRYLQEVSSPQSRNEGVRMHKSENVGWGG